MENITFSEFVKTCIIGNGSMLTQPIDGELFTLQNLQNAMYFLKAFKPEFDKKNEDIGTKNNASNAKEKKWSIGDIFNGNVFINDNFKDIQNNYESHKEAIIKILLHCNWLMYLCSDRQHVQQTINNYYKSEEDIRRYFQEPTRWAIGPTFSGTSLDAMLFIVVLILTFKDNRSTTTNNENRVIEDIIKKCNEIKKSSKDDIKNSNEEDWKKHLFWKEDDSKPISYDAISNILLFLCDQNTYLPIPAQNKKNLISEKLKNLNVELPDDSKGVVENMSDTDINLYKIREQIKSVYIEIAETAQNKDEKEKFLKIAKMTNPFWQPTIRPFWDDSTSDITSKNLTDEVLLEYKKAMVLYGPPGTSKSYQARRIAENMIAKALKNTKTDINKCFNTIDAEFKKHIHILQLHPNYTYEDFIIGKSITVDNNSATKISVKPGKLLKIIAGIESGGNDKLPHIVILDEINRVDISRVFGELFTAMEPSYREKGVELSADISQIEAGDLKGLNIDQQTQKLYLKVPQNMYFIGTMNMIDFSLEQVDFALRRRFVWKLSTYDEKKLDEIISEKVEEEIQKLEGKTDGNEEEINKMMGQWRQLPNNYILCCSSLNDVIKEENSLGQDYVIGHAFFSEIVDIFKKTQDWDSAKKILWHISILPTLKAYCGTMAPGATESFITECEKAFIIP